MKPKEELNGTDNSTVYRRTRWEHLVETGKSTSKCFLCPPHGGCNGRHFERNWKRYRKTQYREVDVSIIPMEPHFQELYEAGVLSRDLAQCLSECRPVEDVIREIKEIEIRERERKMSKDKFRDGNVKGNKVKSGKVWSEDDDFSYQSFDRKKKANIDKRSARRRKNDSSWDG